MFFSDISNLSIMDSNYSKEIEPDRRVSWFLITIKKLSSFFQSLSLFFNPFKKINLEMTVHSSFMTIWLSVMSAILECLILDNRSIFLTLAKFIPGYFSFLSIKVFSWKYFSADEEPFSWKLLLLHDYLETLSS